MAFFYNRRKYSSKDHIFQAKSIPMKKEGLRKVSYILQNTYMGSLQYESIWDLFNMKTSSEP